MQLQNKHNLGYNKSCTCIHEHALSPHREKEDEYGKKGPKVTIKALAVNATFITTCCFKSLTRKKALSERSSPELQLASCAVVGSVTALDNQ